MSFFHYYFPPKMMILAEPNFMRDGYLFSPAMWDLTNPSREMLLGLASIVHPWSDGEGVSEMFVPDALGPGEASAPNWRLTSRRCTLGVDLLLKPT